MKKTSLVLAISALLYGTSVTYVLADDVILSDFINENGELIDSTVNLPAGFNDPQPLPKNVAVDSSNPVDKLIIKMCDTSFAINGPRMAEFPVTVNGNDVGEWSVVGNKTVVKGDGWELELPVGDTWNATWTLTVEPGTVVTSILLEPSKRENADQMWYAFDIGGKLPRFPEPREPYEHTPNAARGQFIVQRTPGTPPPIFTATYSGPVYTNRPIGNSHGDDFPSLDSTNIPLYEDNPGASRMPTHDLYSTLKINFLNGGLTDDVLIDPDFGFVADTDCLPVEAVTINSYENGVLNVTVTGDGAVAIIKDGEQTGLRFEVSRDIDGGIKNFQIPFVPQAGSCYYMMDENTGEVMTPTYCAPN